MEFAADISARKLAPKVLKEGRAYLNRQGYQVLSSWGENAKVIDPMTIDWKAVVAGKAYVRMRQKPGPANSMGKMKFMFPNKQGIWLHDTPEKDVLEESDPARQQRLRPACRCGAAGALAVRACIAAEGREA